MEKLFPDSDYLYDWETAAINEVIEHFFWKLEDDISNKKIASEGFMGYLIIIGEIFELIPEQSKWLEYSYLIMEELKQNIQNGKVKTLGLFGGLADILLAVKLFNAKTGYYERFLKTAENLMLDRAEIYIEACQQNINNVKDYHYDLVSGLTGVGMYLLWDEDIKDRKKAVLKAILDYFVCLCGDNLYQGHIVPGWHIKYENQTREADRQNFSQGNLNFGLAHGILGPLLQFSINNLLSIAKLDNRNYLLESPIICHGYSGVLTILNLAYKEIGHPILKSKIHELMAEIINLYDKNYSYGFVNFGTVEKDWIEVKEYIELYDLLNGATGVVLALIAAIKRDTIWERQLYII